MDTPTTEISPGKEKLASDFRTLVADAEELLRSTAGYSNESIAAARERLNDGLVQLRSFMAEAQTAATERYRQAATATDTYVRENPWQAFGIGVGMVVILGLLLRRS